MFTLEYTNSSLSLSHRIHLEAVGVLADPDQLLGVIFGPCGDDGCCVLVSRVIDEDSREGDADGAVREVGLGRVEGIRVLDLTEVNDSSVVLFAERIG